MAASAYHHRVVNGLDRSTGWIGLGWVKVFSFLVGLGRGSETFPKILKLCRPLLTTGVIPDNLINTDKRVIPDKLSLTLIY